MKMNERQVIDLLVQHGCFAADSAAFCGEGLTRAAITRKQLKAALEMLIGNGVLQITPLPEWPEYIVLDPPYKLPGWSEGEREV